MTRFEAELKAYTAYAEWLKLVDIVHNAFVVAKIPLPEMVKRVTGDSEVHP